MTLKKKAQPEPLAQQNTQPTHITLILPPPPPPPRLKVSSPADALGWTALASSALQLATPASRRSRASPRSSATRLASASAANPLVKTIVPPDTFKDPLFVKKEAPFIRETQNSALFRMPSFPSFGERISHCASSLSILRCAYHHDDGFEDGFEDDDGTEGGRGRGPARPHPHH